LFQLKSGFDDVKTIKIREKVVKKKVLWIKRKKNKKNKEKFVNSFIDIIYKEQLFNR